MNTRAFVYIFPIFEHDVMEQDNVEITGGYIYT